MSTMRFTDRDRDENGFIRLTPLSEQLEQPAVPAPAPEPTPAFAQAISPGARTPLAGGAASARASTPRSRESVTIIAGAVVLVLVLLAVVGVLERLAPRATTATATTPTTLPTAAATALPRPTSAPAVSHRLPRALVAYDAPDGNTLGAIEPGRVYTPTAQLNTEWIQLEVAGSGLIWVKATDLPEVQMTDLPTVTPEQPTARPATAAPAAAPAEPAAPCTPETAPYKVGWRVEVDGLPVGEAFGYSCISQNEAEQRAQEAEVDLKATVTAP